MQNGKIINTEDDNQNIIDFAKFSLDLSRFNTSTITNQKTQEMNTINLLRCIKTIEDFRKIDQITTNKSLFKGCNLQITSSILEEFLKRFLAPLFIIIIGLVSSLIITSSKDQNNYKTKNFIKFVLGIILMVISEMILSFSMKNINDTVLYFFIPMLLFVFIYFYFYLNHKTLKGNSFDN